MKCDLVRFNVRFTCVPHFFFSFSAHDMDLFYLFNYLFILFLNGTKHHNGQERHILSHTTQTNRDRQIRVA